jgi:hypothetical protein
MSNITLDQIIIASKASGISIADLIVSIDNANAATPAQSTAQVTPAPKRNAKKDATMAVKKPSQGQMDRINARHAERNMRTYRTLAEFRAIFPTMLDASIYNAEFSA